MNNNPGSVTLLVEQLRSADSAIRNEAARQIWQRYFGQLLDLTCKQLDPRVRRREDEEDVVLSVYKSLFVRLQRGDYNLENRDDLWSLLVTMARNKARNLAIAHRRQRRDYRREDVPAGPDAASQSRDDFLADLEQAQPTPDDAALLSEELQRRLQTLPEELRQIALWKLEGYTNAEIAGETMLNCSERKVERKLNLIRQRWQERDAAS